MSFDQWLALTPTGIGQSDHQIGATHARARGRAATRALGQQGEPPAYRANSTRRATDQCGQRQFPDRAKRPPDRGSPAWPATDTPDNTLAQAALERVKKADTADNAAACTQAWSALKEWYGLQ